MKNIFFGWWVLLGLFLVYTANNGILLNTLPLLYPELMGEFGWDEEEVTRPAAYFFLIAALITPLFGWLFDRFPARGIMLLSTLVLIGALACYPLIQSLTQLTLIYVALAVGLAGCGILPNMLLLSRWFVRYRGLAVGILLMGSSFGGAIFPLIVKNTLVAEGWREAVWVMTGVGAAMMLGAMILLVRNRPQDLGLQPDGAPPAADLADASAAPAGPGPTLGEAAKRPSFYVLLLATGALWFCIVGLLQHQSIFMGRDLGVSTATLPIIFSVFFWSAIAGKLMFGFFADRFDKTLVMFIAICALIAGLALLRTATPDTLWKLYGYALIYGVGFSGTFAMIQVVVAEFFAGASYGRILGIFTTVDTLAGFAGIKVLGKMRVAGESYIPAFDMLIALCVVTAIAVAGLQRSHARRRRMAAAAA